MTDLTALLERVRAATGAEIELDALVAIAFPPEGEKRTELGDATKRYGKYWYSHKYEEGSQIAPLYTASIDAALALTERLLPGWGSGILSWSAGGKYPVMRMERSHPTNLEVAQEGETRPLAILAALLSALIAQAQP